MKTAKAQMLMIRGIALEANIVNEFEQAQKEIDELISRWEEKGKEGEAAIWLALGYKGLEAEEKEG